MQIIILKQVITLDRIIVVMQPSKDSKNYSPCNLTRQKFLRMLSTSQKKQINGVKSIK